MTTSPGRRGWSLAPVWTADLLVLALGAWQVWATVAVRAKLNFDALVLGLPFPLLAAGVVFAMTREREAEPAESAPAPTGPVPAWSWGLLALAGAAILAWDQLGAPFAVPWVAAVAHLGSVARPPVALRTDLRAGPADAAALGLTAAVAVLATLWIHRPEGDDGYYLNQVVINLTHPHLPVLSFDGMHGDPSYPIQQVAHRAQTWETLVSVVARLTGMEAGDAYYLVVPSAVACVVALASWLLARSLLSPGAARAATALTALVVLAWGGHYYSYGNFGFARLFQGKGAAAIAFLPLVVFYGLRFAERPTWARAALLAAAQCAAAATTSTSLIVAPAAAALAVLPAVTADRRGLRTAALGLLTATPVVVMLLLVKLDLLARDSVVGGSGTNRGFDQVFGGGWRVPLALFGFLALPAVLRAVGAPGATWAARYGLVAFVVLFNDTVSWWLADLTGNLISWRIYWAFPMPVLLACGLVATAGAAVPPGPAVRRVGAGLAAAGLAAAFFAGGRWTFEDDNRSSLDFAKWKVPPIEWRVAEKVVELSGPDSVALVAPGVALRVTAFAERPKLVAVRSGYLRHLEKHLGKRETSDRIKLFALPTGKKKVDLPWAMRQLDARCVDVLVTASTSEKVNPGLLDELVARGFSRERDGRYVVWHRDRARCGQPPQPVAKGEPAPARRKGKRRGRAPAAPAEDAEDRDDGPDPEDNPDHGE